jgi:hypothetical protein
MSSSRTKGLKKWNTEIQSFNTRYNTNLHPPISNLTNFQEGAYYSGIKIFNHLPANIKCLTNDLECCHIALKNFLNSNSFYTLEEFFNCNRKSHMFWVCLLSLGSFTGLSPQFIITMTRIRKSRSWLLLYGCLKYLDKFLLLHCAFWNLKLVTHQQMLYLLNLEGLNFTLEFT